MAKFGQKQLGYGLIGLAVLLLVILSFVMSALTHEGQVLCDLIDENPNMTMSQCPAHNPTTNYLMVMAFGLAFIILASGIFLAAVPIGGQKKESEKIDLSKLDENEQKIYSLLKGSEGSMYQSDIQKQAEMSKVQVTRILDKMESKNIIERKRRGMTNIVVLK